MASIARQEVVHAHLADAVVDLTQEPTATLLPAAVINPMWNDSSRRRSWGRLGRRGRREARHWSRSGSSTAGSWRLPRRPAVAAPAARDWAHLVEVAHHRDVGDDRLVAAVDVARRVLRRNRSRERLAHRGRDASEHRGEALLGEPDVGRELAHHQVGLQRAVGAVALATHADRAVRFPARLRGGRAPASPSRWLFLPSTVGAAYFRGMSSVAARERMITGNVALSRGRPSAIGEDG